MTDPVPLETEQADQQHPPPDGQGLIACHECDLLHRAPPLPAGGKALCSRCGALLYRHLPDGLQRALALNSAALMLFVMANAFPFLSLHLNGRSEENRLISASLAFFREGMWELGTLVFLTSVAFPFVTIAGSLFVLLARYSGQQLPGMAPVYRLVQAVAPWNLIAVFMLGVLVAAVKLLDLASIIPGISLYCFIGLILVSTAARTHFHRHLIWPLQHPTPDATNHDLLSCHTCGLLHPDPGHTEAACPRCHTPLHRRKHDSINRTWALIAAATLLLIPANVYPVMTVIRFGQGEPNTIISGVIHLIEADMWPLALIVFFASFVVPLLKLLVLSGLLLSIHRRSGWRPADRTRLFRATEVIGAWSMVDIFLVAILTALVDLDALATVEPGIGVSFFAAVVVITLFAANSFDPRLIWDHCAPK